MRWLESTTNSTDMNLSKLWEIVGDRGAWCTAVHEKMCIRVLHTYSVWKKTILALHRISSKVPVFISYVCHRCEPRVKK